ncbi:sigma-54-dependent transcriptional regulator [Desulfosporosinus nitroreducens]|uniref:Stage 0 sporulation protein A homolog n=1 Tax=Desulfosporosinus nitroreducens TaxID=2018668 RepID=A0ABT8QMS4_9FIRM|nr:sigma-54 dependent transcriptional regulator [Desulfosporosinus nitroreducens]MDO0821854.1 sigma-54 dependent transcriptional regulator [Desulfosporosinus nitroreducens]
MNIAEILVVDDEIEVCTFFNYYFQEIKQLPVHVDYSGELARKDFQKNKYDLALIDLKLPDTDGITLLKEIKTLYPNCEVIIMTGYSTVKSAVEAMKYGAFDYIDKPFNDLGELDEIIDRTLQFIQSKQTYVQNEMKTITTNFGIVISENSPMKEILLLARKIASKKLGVLIEGETGTGKELAARYIHNNSPRSSHPFIAINCGALTESLLESELFGHEKGAFTGAISRRRGVFEIANNGTLLLDEIGDASPAIQLKLLRVLETGEFYRVGGETPLKSDVRILAASNKNLRQAVKDHLFREDLLYRLDVVDLKLPPLRERVMDIEPLINYFIEKNLSDKQTQAVFTKEAITMLQNYSWPGNIRELSNIVSRAMVLREGSEMDEKCLPPYLLARDEKHFEKQNNENVELIEDPPQTWTQHMLKTIMEQDEVNLPEVIRMLEQQNNDIICTIIMKALDSTKNNQNEAAKLLHINPRTLRYLKNEKVKTNKNF